MTAGQVRDYTGAEALLGSLPKADWLLADRVYDAGWFREALKENGTKPCIPGRKSRGKPIKHDKRRNRIEIIFGRLKDRQRAPERRAVATLVTRDMGICCLWGSEASPLCKTDQGHAGRAFATASHKPSDTSA